MGNFLERGGNSESLKILKKQAWDDVVLMRVRDL